MTYLMDSVKQQHPKGRNKIQSKGNFQIKIAPETFRMFSAGLYSDPIKAIIREYSTNAKDAHTEAGVPDKPFDVQLPTLSNNYEFMIRDYGTGMSQEKIETIIQTYGASTKGDTNECTGMFGLGSKAALSYVRSFFLVSYYKGTQYNYLVVMDDNEVPELLFSGSIPTEEPNGVKIQFNISAKDVNKFIKAAQEVYPYFDVLPNFIGDCGIVIEKPVYLREQDEDGFSWKVRQKTSHYNEDNHSYIIMGCNKYPLSDSLRAFNKSIDFYVPIDEFRPTPSRESLQWDEIYEKRFKEMMKAVDKRIDAQFRQEIKGLKDWEITKLVDKTKQSYIDDRIAQIYDTSKLKYLSEDSKGSNYNIYFNVWSLRITSLTVDVRQKYLTRSGNIAVDKTYDKNQKDSGVELNVKNIYKVNSISIVIYDAKNIKSAIEDEPVNTTIIIGSPTSKTNDQDALELTKIFDREKIPYTLTKVSTLLANRPKVAKVKTKAPEVVTTTGVFELNGNLELIHKEKLKGLKYYIEFDDDTSFNVTNFIKPHFDTTIIGSTRLNAALNKVSLRTIAEVLNIKTDNLADQTCFIRPKYAKDHPNLLKLNTVLDEHFEKLCENNLLLFIAWLDQEANFSERFGRDNHSNSYISTKTNELISYLFNSNNIYFHHYCKYPFLQTVMKLATQHKLIFRCDDVDYDQIFRYYSNYDVTKSKQLEQYAHIISNLYVWYCRPNDFYLKFKPYCDRLNEEAEAIHRSYPYLFKSSAELIHNSLIYQQPNNP